MIGFILRYLGGPFGTVIMWAVAAAFAALMLTVGWQRIDIYSLRADVSKAQADNVQLQGQVRHQNDEVARIGQDCQAKADAAVVLAMRALNSPPPPAAGTGPTYLNKWLTERARAR